MPVSHLKTSDTECPLPLNKVSTEISKKEPKADDHNLFWTDDDK